MTLEVIGSGFGRTGTSSLKAALNQLGFGPCHHMEEVLGHPEQVPFWVDVAEGKPIDLHAAFEGYRSQVDWPGAHVWRELTQAFPDTKVIHTVRCEAGWWNSFSQTIGKLLSLYPELPPMPPHVQAMMAAAQDFIGFETFGGQFADRDAALAAYRRRREEVVAAIPPERLLIFDVAEGWAPLCAFLGAPVPEAPFPRLNSTEEFWEQVGGKPG